MHNWDLIRAFLALQRSGSFERAGQLLGVDHSTLRRRIQKLEQAVGLTLFTVEDGFYTVRPAAAPMLSAAQQMELAARLFFCGRPDEVEADVRITVMDLFAHWLAPSLAEFGRLHPMISLKLTTEHKFVDLEREMVDVAVRLARPTRGQGKIKRLAEIRYGIYASSQYLENHRRLGEDAEHNLILFSIHFTRDHHEFLESESEWMLRHLPMGKVVCEADSYMLLRQYCCAGLGLALLPEIMVEPEHDLVCLTQNTARCDLWLVVNENTAQLPRVRKLVEFLSLTFKQRLRDPGDRLEDGACP